MKTLMFSAKIGGFFGLPGAIFWKKHVFFEKTGFFKPKFNDFATFRAKFDQKNTPNFEWKLWCFRSKLGYFFTVQYAKFAYYQAKVTTKKAFFGKLRE